MLSALIGGFLIGLSALLLLQYKGRIAGICGMIFSLYDAKTDNKLWRWLFLVSLMFGTYLSFSLFNLSMPDAPTASPWLIAVAGLITGVGTFLANGCTSGHGVCGIGRGSVRSLVATMTFMFTGIVTVTFINHILM